jgi:hypothetical protein
VALLGAVLVAAGVGLAGRAQAGDAERRLPDLIVYAPFGLELTAKDGHARLGFASAAANVGAGPLVVQGRRRPGAETMAAVQEVELADGSFEEVGGVGRLRYVVSPDHVHWHFLPFMRYELHPAGSPGRVLRDSKTGFCLGDRFDTSRQLAGKPEKSAFFSRCGLRSPYRLGVREGISVGWGDDYKATLEGQYVDITDLPGGLYVLVHWVNQGRNLRESRYDNDVSSTLLRLERSGGRITVSSLKRCPGRATCSR